jgi:hypothetical protein
LSLNLISLAPWNPGVLEPGSGKEIEKPRDEKEEGIDTKIFFEGVGRIILSSSLFQADSKGHGRSFHFIA